MSKISVNSDIETYDVQCSRVATTRNSSRLCDIIHGKLNDNYYGNNHNVRISSYKNNGSLLENSNRKIHVVDHITRVYHTMSSDNSIGNESISESLKKCGKPQRLCHTIGTPTVETKLMSKKSTQISVPTQKYM